MKKLIVSLLALAIALGLAGCGGTGTVTIPDLDVPGAGPAGSSSADSADSSSSSSEEGVNEGRIGQRMSTYFFDFTVKSAAIVERDDYTPAEGNALMDVYIEVTNTFGDTLPMFDSDFELWWGDRYADEDQDKLAIVLDALDEEGAPLEYDLEDGQTLAYHYLYEVPADVKSFEVLYLEAFESDSDDGEYGDAHFVKFSI